ncbi:hypothetical protein ABQ472_16840, partial [Citrobacter freundii]
DSELLLCHGMVCVVGRMRDLILQLSKSSIYSTKPFIKTNTLDCQSYPWVYLTLYPNFPRISALTCRKQFSRWQDNDCVTHYYFAESRHVGT